MRSAAVSGKTALLIWLILSIAALAARTRIPVSGFLWIIPAPLIAAAALYFLVFLHEAGHLFFGYLLRFPVMGMEIGEFPFQTFRLGKLSFRIGRLPWWGRTVLGVTSRSFSPLSRALFITGGTVFELIFFAGYFLLTGRVPVLLALGIFLLADQLFVNLYPKYENGRAVNDGALLVEIFSPKSLSVTIGRSIF